jgi:hypothetical protein
MKKRTHSIFVLVAALFMIAMNRLSTMGVFGWRTVEQISYAPNELLVPASFTFSIRWVIYIGLLAFSIYQLSKKALDDKVMKRIRPWVILNFVANGLWLPAATWLTRSWLSVVLIICMWISLGYINKYFMKSNYSNALKRCTVIPMSVYFGWITIATPLNIASVVNQRGFAPAVQSVPWVMLRIWLAYVTSIVVFTRLRNISYILVTLRALFGIAMKRQYDSPILMRTAIWLGILTVLYIVYRKSQNKVLAQ